MPAAQINIYCPQGLMCKVIHYVRVRPSFTISRLSRRNISWSMQPLLKKSTSRDANLAKRFAVFEGLKKKDFG